MASSTSDNVFARIQKAYKLIAAQGFSKTGKVEGKGEAHYNFIPIGQILEAVRKAQADAGLTVVFGRPEYDHDNHEKRWEYKKKKEDFRTGKEVETTWFAAVGHIEVRIYGTSADDVLEMEIPFEAQDNSDKLTNKIITNAERCLYRTLYSIDEGSEDPEEVNVPMESEPIPAPQDESKYDRFFKPGIKPEPIPAPKAEPTDVTADRPRSTMVQTIVKASKDMMLRPVVKKAIQEADASEIDTDQWTDDQVKHVYKAVIKAGRGAE